jgi:Stage III sporulation protein D
MEATEYGGPSCQEVRGLRLDAAVEQLVLAALAPARLVLALDALEQLAREVDALEHQWQLRLERVRYEAQRAQRQDEGVEPANRLVARVLESQWEEQRRVVEQTAHDYATWKKANHTALPSKEREEMLAIGEDLPRVWHAQTTTSADRKPLLRLVVKAVRVDQKRQPGQGCCEISWQGGARTVHDIDRLGVSDQDVSGRDRLKQRLGQLHAQRSSDAHVAQVRNAEGYRTAKGRPFRGKNVWYLRRLWGLSGEQAGAMTADGLRWSDNRYTVRGAAQAVGVSKSTVHRWLTQGRLEGGYLGARTLWRIQLTSRQMNI